MSAVGAVLRELWGLFVDDGLFALLILIWLVVVWGLPRLGIPAALACILFAVGLAALLVASTARRAAQRD